jgi:hypothetical protein
LFDKSNCLPHSPIYVGRANQGTWTYSLQSNGEFTIVRITEDGQVYNPVFRFMSRFVLGETRTMDVYLRALARATGQEVKLKDRPPQLIIQQR